MAANEISAEAAPSPSPAVPVSEPKAKARSWAQNLVGTATLLAICYYAEAVLAAILVAVLLAFILAPVVDLLVRIRLPRSLASAFAVLLLLCLLIGTIYYSYNQASSFLDDLPKYTHKIRDDLSRFRKKAESLEVLSSPQEKGVVNVRPATDWADVLTRGFGSASQAIFAASFIPFLVYFMLSWQEHVHSATVMLFPMRSRHTAYVTLGLISSMIRSFVVGSVLIALFMGAVSTAVFGVLHLPFFCFVVGSVLIALFIGAASTAVFGVLHLPFFYFVGFLSGFLSMVPYLGALLAIAPPMIVGLGHFSSQDTFYIIVTVIGLRVISMNILYPKFLGNRVRLNPLAVTIGLLVWGWLWGAIGLLLAVPITAAIKIVFDNVESLKPYGAWLGE